MRKLYKRRSICLHRLVDPQMAGCRPPTQAEQTVTSTLALNHRINVSDGCRGDVVTETRACPAARSEGGVRARAVCVRGLCMRVAPALRAVDPCARMRGHCTCPREDSLVQDWFKRRVRSGMFRRSIRAAHARFKSIDQWAARRHRRLGCLGKAKEGQEAARSDTVRYGSSHCKV